MEGRNFFCLNDENADKDQLKNALDNSENELTEFIEILTQDAKEPEQSEIDSGIKKILKRAEQTDEPKEIGKSNVNKKLSIKVLFVAAIIVIVSICSISVVATNNDIKIRNSFVTFDGSNVHIAFFGDSNEKNIPIKSLLNDLQNKEFGKVLLVEEVAGLKSEYGKITLPRYENNAKQVCFEITSNEIEYYFDICKIDVSEDATATIDINNAEIITVDDIDVYISYSEEKTEIQFVYNNLHYFVSTNDSYEEIVRAVELIDKGTNNETNNKD